MGNEKGYSLLKVMVRNPQMSVFDKLQAAEALTKGGFYDGYLVLHDGLKGTTKGLYYKMAVGVLKALVPYDGQEKDGVKVDLKSLLDSIEHEISEDAMEELKKIVGTG